MSVTFAPADLRCSLPNVSVKTAVLSAGLTLTFLDAQGDYLGNWMPQTGAVYVTANEVGHATTADEAGTMLLAYEPAPKKASKKASLKTFPPKKTPVQATARTASTTTKESTMTSTPSNTVRLTALESAVSDLRDGQAQILALLEARTPAKAPVAKAPTAKAPTKAPTGKVSRCTAKTLAGKRCARTGLNGKCGSHSEVVEVAKAAVKAGKKVTKAEAKAIVAAKATKGTRPVAGGSGLSRSAWNKTLTAKARLAGKGKGGKSVISLVTSAEGWAKVQAMRTEGMTPDQVLARFTK